ncbi:hypothetical protein [Streptomyces cyaneofuscatus]|uniref:Uncharacterized protein n=1 Tax=Streptomyces cyaneofuscatus TaxID=66883 RepID=A0ABZ1F6E5_9ACTN|nr:hypothetical protein [Streptomyces cyaneofuscatus]WSB11897.1 hypothetical protein OG849_33855 [Streptomyces cyaneofuscatus]WSD44570.1 hypothetical protein OG857_01545 [Streptomyces cyaneofuscatus]
MALVSAGLDRDGKPPDTASLAFREFQESIFAMVHGRDDAVLPGQCRHAVGVGPLGPSDRVPEWLDEFVDDARLVRRGLGGTAHLVQAGSQALEHVRQNLGGRDGESRLTVVEIVQMCGELRVLDQFAPRAVRWLRSDAQ